MENILISIKKKILNEIKLGKTYCRKCFNLIDKDTPEKDIFFVKNYGDLYYDVICLDCEIGR